MAFSLVYVSEISPALQTDVDVQRAALLAIETAARKHNPAVGVRGVLVYVAGYFIQWLEGDELAVRQLMQRIASDKRHAQVQVVYEGNNPARLNEWSMSLATRADKDNAIGQLIARLRMGQMPEAATGSVPADIFQGLLAPSDVSLPGQQKKRCQVALLGQTGLWSAAVVTYLSDLWRVPVQRTRLIGSQGFEREALLEYVDADHPVLGPVRVINFSGPVLQLPWIGSLLENVQSHALFYSVNQQDAALEFTDTVLRLLPSSEKISKTSSMACLFGRTARPLMEPAQGWFKARGLTVHPVSMSLADVAAVWQVIENLTQAQHAIAAPPAANKVPLQLIASPAAAKAAVQIAVAPAPAVVVKAVAPPAKALQLVPQKPAPITPQEVLTAPAVVKSQSAALPTLGAEAVAWLQSLLDIRGVLCAGLQLGELNATVHTATSAEDTRSAAEVKIQSQQFKTRLAQEARLHKLLRRRVDIAESVQMVTRCSNSFEVSFGLPAPNGPVMVMLQSHFGSPHLAVVLSSLEKRLIEPMPVFFQLGVDQKNNIKAA